jgi:integrase
MNLNDSRIRSARPADKPKKLFDGGGLFLFITPNGGKFWRVKYKFQSKEKLLSLGAYPHVSLKDARTQRDEAKALLAKGIDPGEKKKAEHYASAHTFEAVTREWFARHGPTLAPGHADKIIRRFERDVFPWLGSQPVADVTPRRVLEVLRYIESRGTLETAHRAKQNIGQVMRYAVATGRAERDPTQDLKGALPALKEDRHFPAFTDPAKVGALLRALDAFKGSFQVACALKLAPLVFVRPGELRTAKWQDIDFPRAEWRFITSKTRMDHLVPLSRQAIAILQSLFPFTSSTGWVFPGRDFTKPMSEVTINAALQRLGFDTKTEMTAHGFRAMARTLLHEQLGFQPEVIEHQLAHRVPDRLGAAYNRTRFLEQRKTMMQAWADYLEQLKAGTPLHRVA